MAGAPVAQVRGAERVRGAHPWGLMTEDVAYWVA